MRFFFASGGGGGGRQGVAPHGGFWLAAPFDWLMVALYATNLDDEHYLFI